jgi:hypothetical protein
MTTPTPTPPHPQPATRGARRPTHRERRFNRGPSVQLVSEAIVASYIHDISERHRDARAPGARLRRVRGAQLAIGG